MWLENYESCVVSRSVEVIIWEGKTEENMKNLGN